MPFYFIKYYIFVLFGPKLTPLARPHFIILSNTYYILRAMFFNVFPTYNMAQLSAYSNLVLGFFRWYMGYIYNRYKTGNTGEFCGNPHLNGSIFVINPLYLTLVRRSVIKFSVHFITLFGHLYSLKRNINRLRNTASNIFWILYITRVYICFLLNAFLILYIKTSTIFVPERLIRAPICCGFNIWYLIIK